MFGSHLEAAADVMEHHMAEIVPPVVVRAEEVATDAAADINMFDTGDGGDFLVEFDKRTVVGLEVAAHGGLDATEAGAPFAEFLVAARHAVHVGRGAAEVGDNTVEVGTLNQLVHLAQNRVFGTRGYLFALMGGDGAERATTKTTAMDVDRVLYHLVGWNGTALFVFGMGQAEIGQIERGIDFVCSHRGLGRIDHHIAVAVPLDEGGALYLVAFLLDDMIVFGLTTLALLAFLEGVEGDSRTGRTSQTGRTCRTGQAIGYLGEGVAGLDAFALVEQLANEGWCARPCHS